MWGGESLVAATMLSPGHGPKKTLRWVEEFKLMELCSLGLSWARPEALPCGLMTSYLEVCQDSFRHNTCTMLSRCA